MADKILFLGMSFVIVVLALSHIGPGPEAPAEEIAAAVGAPPSTFSATGASVVAGHSEALQDAILCLETAFWVCEEYGQDACGVSFEQGCWFECCDEARDG